MPETKDSAERLAEAMEQLSDDINGLMEVAEQGTLLKELVDEARTLRAAIDDVRAEIEWAARNLAQKDQWVPQPQPITSMPRDPCDPNFAARLNAVSHNDLPTADGDEDDAEGVDERAEEEADAAAGDEESQESDAGHSHATQAADNDALSDGNAPAGVTEVKRRTAGKSPTTAPNGQPLHLRLYFQRHMTDLVRLIGHAEHGHDEFLARVEPLYARYGEEAVKQGLDELVDVTRRDQEEFVCLKPAVRQLAVQIIGHPPASTS